MLLISVLLKYKILQKPNFSSMFPSDHGFCLNVSCVISIKYMSHMCVVRRLIWDSCKCGSHAKRGYLMYLLREAEALYGVNAGKEERETVGFSA